MTPTIPYRVEINNIIELLASQIYQTPLALLRENCQNAYDAILDRRWRDSQFTDAQISVEIMENYIRIIDNGIGMTPEELDAHYWRAGSSGKNNPESRAAGVVGTFGIGAMANFGVASELTITTESFKSNQRTRSHVERARLSATEPCITIESIPEEGNFGTTVDIRIENHISIDVPAAVHYISEAVRYLPVPVYVNGVIASEHSFTEDFPQARNSNVVQYADVTLGNGFQGTVNIAVSPTGEPWVRVSELRESDNSISGEIILIQDRHQIHGYRSGFSLAVTGVQSYFGLGGVANLSLLTPTAGREALTTASVQFLQDIVTGLERLIAEYMGTLEVSDNNTKFMEWVRRHGRFELCDYLTVQLEPGKNDTPLSAFNRSQDSLQWNLYVGRDQSIIDSFATDERPLVVLAATQPRRACQEGYLNEYANISQVSDQPTVIELKPEFRWTLSESSLAFRICAVLESDYFVPSVVKYGKISHGLPLIVNSSTSPVEIILDSQSSTIEPILQLYDTDYSALSSFVKDFVRNAIFQKISALVPSSTRDGAAAFLKSIRRPADVFEYEHTDLGTLSEVWQEYAEGRISMVEAARRSASIAQSTIQIIDSASSSTVDQILSDVVENDKNMPSFGQEDELLALPPITRMDVSSTAKLLLVDEGEDALRGYRGFIALTDRYRRDNIDFFLQPHRTEVVWGGQKALYIFMHHSGEFGIYYELQGNEIMADGPGGARVPTCTIIVKDQIYLPIPTSLLANFEIGPTGRKRFEVRCDLLFTESGSSG